MICSVQICSSSLRSNLGFILHTNCFGNLMCFPRCFLSDRLCNQVVITVAASATEGRKISVSTCGEEEDAPCHFKLLGVRRASVKSIVAMACWLKSNTFCSRWTMDLPSDFSKRT